MAILPKAIYRFNVTAIKIIHDLFHRTRTNNPKTCVELQKTQNCQSNPEEKEQSRKHNFPRLQIILQSYSNQNSMVLAWNRIENPEINTHTYGQLIFGKGGKNIQRKTESL